MPSSPSRVGRILAVLSLAFLLTISFSVITTPNTGHTHSLHGRDLQVFRRSASESPSDVPPPASASNSGISNSATPSSKSASPSAPSSAAPSTPPPSSAPASPSSPSHPSSPPSSSSHFTPSSTSETPAVTPSSNNTPSSSPTQSTTTTTFSTHTVPPSVPSGTTVLAPSAIDHVTGNSGGTQISPVSDPSSTDSESHVAAATSNGFWQDKGAVAGTFVVVALVVLSIVVAIVLHILRKNRNRANNDDFFEKYTDAAPQSPQHEYQQYDGGLSPGPSMHDLTAPAPPDAYPDRQIHYGDVSNARISGVEYPPGTTGYVIPSPSSSPAPQDAPGNQTYAASVHTLSPPTSPHPFADPSNAAPVSRRAPPVAFRPHFGRDEYEPSIDSFYGSQSLRTTER